MFKGKYVFKGSMLHYYVVYISDALRPRIANTALDGDVQT